MRWAVCVPLLAGVATTTCATSQPASPALDPLPSFEQDAGDGLSDDASDDATDGDADAGLPPPQGNTWSYLYAKYFGATSKTETPGHCGRSSCHLNVNHGFRCGSDAHTCYAGMLGAGLVDTSNPSHSLIARPESPLKWIAPATGNMPLDDAVPNPQAAADILAWVAAGAAEDVDAEASPDASDAASD